MDEPQDKQAGEDGIQTDPPIIPPSISLQSDNEDATKVRSTGKKEVNKIDDTPKKERLKEFLNAGADRHIELILAFAITFFAAAQWLTSCNNNSSTSRQTERLLDAANRINDAADSFSKSSADISSGVGGAVDKLNLQAGALNSSVTQATRLAKATEIANKNVVDADRPWIGGFFVVSNFEVGHRPTYTFTFINSGKRPARLILTATKENFYLTFPPNPDKEYVFDTTPSTTVIVPGQNAMTIDSAKGDMTQQEMDFLKAGGGIFFAFAKVEYVDIRTNTPHWTHICMRFFPEFKVGNDNGWRNCQEYNDAE